MDIEWFLTKRARYIKLKGYQYVINIINVLDFF